MELDADHKAVAEDRGDERAEAYEPPSLTDLGSLRDLVAAGGNTVPDADEARPGP